MMKSIELNIYSYKLFSINEIFFAIDEQARVVGSHY